VHKSNPWVKRRGIDEIPGGDGRGCRGEIGDALGWTGIEGEGMLTRKVLFSMRERGENYVFHVRSNEVVGRMKEKIRLKREAESIWVHQAVEPRQEAV
jgi:hypothetical protein